MSKDRQFKNLIRLGNSPVKGNFDVAHLKEIHRRICEGEPDFAPGMFRPPAKAGKDQVKKRHLESVNIQSFVTYAPMDDESLNELEAVLARANPERLQKLKADEFIKELCDIYVRLDYIHPFEDGNSRTLRVFTKQLAEESGYDLDWSVFNTPSTARDKLYIARDNAVRNIGYDKIREFGNKQQSTLSTDILGSNMTISELLKDANAIRRTKL